MRKGVIILSLVLLVLLSSGCVQTNPEERAIAIADQLPEVRLMSKAVDSMQRVDQCTFDKFYSEYKKISEIFSEGTPVPELTESQRGQIEGMIEEMGALVNRCQIMLSKSAEKESENMYIVHYKLETISDPECSMLSEGDIGVRVDLSTEKAEPIGGSREIEEKYVEAFDAMGDCAAILMGSVSGVSKIPQMSPAPTVALKTTTAPTITSAPTTTPAPTTFAPTTTTAGTPTVDVAGQDISDIPRYTGSVMIVYGEDVMGTIPGTVVVAYLTSASIDTVLDFYQTQLPANGWTVIDMGEVSKMPLAMKGGRGSVVVTITASEDYSGYTDINIVFVPE